MKTLDHKSYFENNSISPCLVDILEFDNLRFVFFCDIELEIEFQGYKQTI